MLIIRIAFFGQRNSEYNDLNSTYQMKFQVRKYFLNIVYKDNYKGYDHH